MLTYWAGVK